MEDYAEIKKFLTVSTEFSERIDMLVLGRAVGESIIIGENIRIVIVKIGKHKVSIGIDAPRSVSVARNELLSEEENQLVIDKISDSKLSQ